MLDFRVSSHTHFDDACSKFAASHNVRELAVKAGIKPHTLYNKLNPEQPHQLTPREIWVLTDLTEDSTLVDGLRRCCMRVTSWKNSLTWLLMAGMMMCQPVT